MWQNAHDAYLESRILSANPLELVHLLYQACINNVREARSHLAEGDIASRCRCIGKAHAILAELATSLDRQRGGDLSRRLAQLYDYMQRQLIQANFQQSDAPLAEVLGLLVTLSEAWVAIQTPAEPVATPTNPWAQPIPEAEPVLAAHGWSL